jgi:hypothetical protein
MPAKAKAVEQSRSDVLGYWTPERMRNAIPLDAVRGAAAQRKRPKAPFSFTRYEPTTASTRVRAASSRTGRSCPRTATGRARTGQRGDFSYDLDAAVVNTSGGTTLTDTLGSRGAGFNQSATQHYLAHGYPAASPFTGGRMFICESDLGTRDASANPPTMGIGCDMTGGSSGGGWVVGNTVLSVNSYGYSNLPNVIFGPYQGTVAQQLYTSAAGS